MIKISLKTAILSLTLLYSAHLCAQPAIKSGVNLSNWFEKTNINQVIPSYYTRQDFENIKSLGANTVRLPIKMHDMSNGKPDYTLPPQFFEKLDRAVNFAEELNMYIIIDNHSFTPSVGTQLDVEEKLLKIWKQVASHYRDRSEYVIYEILNEPHGEVIREAWGAIQQKAIDVIRQEDQRHYIIVGGGENNSYTELEKLPHYSDPKLIYSFHFYDPFLLTHQSSTWAGKGLSEIGYVPFPYRKKNMPAMPTSMSGVWTQRIYDSYPTLGTVKSVKKLLDIAVKFKKERGVQLFCGEFGVYRINAIEKDRQFWYKYVREYLEKHDIAWTIWDYKGGFGLFNLNSNEEFDKDLNTGIMSALGFKVNN